MHRMCGKLPMEMASFVSKTGFFTQKLASLLHFLIENGFVCIKNAPDPKSRGSGFSNLIGESGKEIA